MHTIGRSYTFCAAHRILGHEGKCKNLHGHTYTAEIILSLGTQENLGFSCTVDDLGRILDYNVMDEVFGAWIKENWDHGALLHDDDPVAKVLDHEGSKLKTFSLQPTAEVLASRLFCVCSELMRSDRRFDHVILSRVRIKESSNSFAEVS